jgi:hypothetical protein
MKIVVRRIDKQAAALHKQTGATPAPAAAGLLLQAEGVQNVGITVCKADIEEEGGNIKNVRKNKGPRQNSMGEVI